MSDTVHSRQQDRLAATSGRAVRTATPRRHLTLVPEDRGTTVGAGLPDRRDPDPYRHLEGALERLAATDPADPARHALRNELAVAFAPVCRNVTRRFARQGEPTDDLEQVATIGLLKALDHFRLPPGYDPIRAFIGYAVPTVVGEVQRHLRDHTWVVHVPRPVKEIRPRLWRAVADLTSEHGRCPRSAELAAYLQVDEELVVEALQAGSAHRPRSTDTPLGPTGERLTDGLGDLDHELAALEDRAELREALRHLPPRSLRIIAMRFFGELTQSQIAHELGISQMHVSRLLSRSLATLREAMAPDRVAARASIRSVPVSDGGCRSA